MISNSLQGSAEVVVLGVTIVECEGSGPPVLGLKVGPPVLKFLKLPSYHSARSLSECALLQGESSSTSPPILSRLVLSEHL